MADSSVQELIIKYRADVTDLATKVSLIEGKLRSADTRSKEFTSHFKAGADKATESASGLSKEIDRVEGRMARIAERIVAAFAVERIIHFGEEAVKAFAAAELAQTKLNFAITKIIGGTTGQVEELIRQSEILTKQSFFSPRAIQESQAMQAQFGLTAEEIQKLTPEILNLATALNTDLGSATDTALRAIEGQTRGLKTVGADFKDTGNAVSNYNLLIGNLAKLNGLATEALNTTSGALKDQEKEVEILKEKIGAQLSGAFVAAEKAGLSFTSNVLTGLRLILQPTTLLKELNDEQRKAAEDQVASSVKQEFAEKTLGQIQAAVRAGREKDIQIEKKLDSEREQSGGHIRIATHQEQVLNEQRIKTLEELIALRLHEADVQKISSEKIIGLTVAELNAEIASLKKRSDASTTDIKAEIKRREDLVTDLLNKQKQADDAALKQREEASNKLAELDRKINDDLLKTQTKSPFEILAVEKEIAQKELQITFEASQKTLKDKNNLIDALLALDLEYKNKERDIRLKQAQENATQNINDAKNRVSTAKQAVDEAKTIFDNAKAQLDTQQVNRVVQVKQTFDVAGDFSPEAIRKKDDEILQIGVEFDNKKLEEEKKFIDSFQKLNDDLFLKLKDAAEADKNKISVDFFAKKDFSFQAVANEAKALNKVDADLANERKKLSDDVKRALGQNEADIAEAHNKAADAQLAKDQVVAQKKIEIQHEIRDAILTGVEDVIAETEKRSNDEQIKSIEAVRDAQLKSIDDQIAANDKARQNGVEGRKAYEAKNKELLDERVKAEDAAAAKIKAIKKQQFIADQAEAVSKVIIANTINAAEFPALTEFYAALAAIQIGIILARPNPYKKGTKSAKEGPALVGEEGPELVVMKGGSKVLTAEKTKKYADAVDAMTDGKFEEHVKKVFVEPALVEQARRISKTNLTETEISERVTKTVTTILRNIQKDENESFAHTFSIAENAIRVTANRPSIKIPEFSFQGVPVKKVFKTESIDNEMLSVEKLHTILSKLHVVEHLKEATHKHEIKKQEVFANNIANSFLIQKDIIGMTAKQQKKIFKEGSPVTNSKEIAKHMAKEIAKLIPDNKQTARRYS